MPSNQTEVVAHDDPPLLKLVQELQLFDPGLLLLIYEVVVDLQHGVDLHALEPCLEKPVLLIVHHRISIDAYQGTASACEVFDHHLAKPVLGVKHLVAEEEAAVEFLGEHLEHLVELVGVDVADNAFAEEQRGYSE